MPNPQIIAVVPAKAGTHIPEPVVMDPQHKRVYARLRRAMRADDSYTSWISYNAVGADPARLAVRQE